MKPLHLIMCCVSFISRQHKFLNPFPKEFTDNDWSPCETFHESHIHFGHHCLNRVTTYDPNQLTSLTSQITKTLDFDQESCFIRSANALLKNRLYFCFQHSSVKRNTAMNVLLLKYSLSIFIFPPRRIKLFGTFFFCAHLPRNHALRRVSHSPAGTKTCFGFGHKFQRISLQKSSLLGHFENLFEVSMWQKRCFDLHEGLCF